MKTSHRAVIDLVKASLTGEAAALGEDTDWTELCLTGHRHGILPMLYCGALASGAVLPGKIGPFLKKSTLDSACVDQRQRQELDRIEESFQRENIDYLLLKGTVLKKIYPQPELRIMGDADILIRVEQYDRIRQIMQQLGFTETLEADPEIVWDKKNDLNQELHKRLFEPANKGFFAYFGDGWKLARKAEGSRYEMGDEDVFVYLFTHYAKHYRNGGIGIRHITDLYVFSRAKKDLDMAYIAAELDKLGLLAFYEHTMEMVAVWFDGAADSQVTDFLTEKIIASGSFGTSQAATLSAGVRTMQTGKSGGGRTRKLLSLLFPPLHTQLINYPILKKWPVLLPLVWVHRWVYAALFKRKAVKQNMEKVELLSAQKLLAWQAELDYVGLKFELED